MTNKLKDVRRTAIAVCGIAVVALATGCAAVTPEQLEEVRTLAQAAQSDANSAQSAANEARQLASGAQSTANQALRAAQDAQACCDATNQRIDRVFEATTSK